MLHGSVCSSGMLFVHKCAACGGSHTSAEVARLGGFTSIGGERVTHVFQCPVTSEPVYLCEADVRAQKTSVNSRSESII